MTGIWHTRRALVFAVLAATAVLVGIAMVYPKPIPAPGLGSGWQCSATAFSTSCTQVHRAGPAVMRSFGKRSVRLQAA